MSRNRYAAKSDSNQKEIVKSLRKLGFSVETNHDDILIGAHGATYWIEIKNPDCVSPKTGKIRESAKKEGQKTLEQTWKGQYNIVSSLEEILEIIKEDYLNKLRSD